MMPNRFMDYESGILSHKSISNLVEVKKDNSSNEFKSVVDENAHTDGSFQSLYS